jgi:N utilization substance protein A
MFDLKVLNSALLQLEEEKGIPRDKILGAIEDALAAAYKKDYGKKGQIVRAKFDIETGKVQFYRVKIVVDESIIRPDVEEGVEEDLTSEEAIEKIRFNEEQHMMLADAQKMKAGAELHDEIIFPLEEKDDYGRIAAQTAKQVIMQRLREAERLSVMDEYVEKRGEILNGTVQRIERGAVFVDLGRVTAIIPREEQIPGEYYRQGERIRALLLAVNETPRGIELRLSRSHPQFLAKLFSAESPEVASETVVLAAIAREAGSRTKIAVKTNDKNIDPVGSMVGQRGVRVNTVINELGGEKIDIIEWSENPETFITHAISPAKVLNVITNEEERSARVEVDNDQFSLAIGKGGQNVRLAAKLTGWKIDIFSPTGESTVAPVVEEKIEEPADEVIEETPTEDAAPAETTDASADTSSASE